MQHLLVFGEGEGKRPGSYMFIGQVEDMTGTQRLPSAESKDGSGEDQTGFALQQRSFLEAAADGSKRKQATLHDLVEAHSQYSGAHLGSRIANNSKVRCR